MLVNACREHHERYMRLALFEICVQVRPNACDFCLMERGLRRCRRCFLWGQINVPCGTPREKLHPGDVFINKSRDGKTFDWYTCGACDGKGTIPLGGTA